MASPGYLDRGAAGHTGNGSTWVCAYCLEIATAHDRAPHSRKPPFFRRARLSYRELGTSDRLSQRRNTALRISFAHFMGKQNWPVRPRWYNTAVGGRCGPADRHQATTRLGIWYRPNPAGFRPFWQWARSRRADGFALVRTDGISGVPWAFWSVGLRPLTTDHQVRENPDPASADY